MMRSCGFYGILDMLSSQKVMTAFANQTPTNASFTAMRSISSCAILALLSDPKMTPAQVNPAAQFQIVPRRRWGIAMLLGLGVLVNYFDRVNLSVSRDALQDAFGISAVMFGYLSSAYNWSY